MNTNSSDHILAKKWETIGRYPQLTMILTFGLIIFLSSNGESVVTNSHLTKALRIAGVLGGLVFVHCLYVLYTKQARTKELITDGLFKYTRHPMYTGFLLMAIDVGKNLNPQSIIHTIAFSTFLMTLFAAGYAQERETLARFGEEAIEYYKKTPRIFLFYPFTKS